MLLRRRSILRKLISRYYFWPRLGEDVKDYVRGCKSCQRNKSVTEPKAGRLMPLPVPSGVWVDISLDFVGPLPKTEKGADAILVVVDRLSRTAHFIACTMDSTAKDVADLFVKHVFCLHGLPKSIVTDTGANF